MATMKKKEQQPQRVKECAAGNEHRREDYDDEEEEEVEGGNAIGRRPHLLRILGTVRLSKATASHLPLRLLTLPFLQQQTTPPQVTTSPLRTSCDG